MKKRIAIIVPGGVGGGNFNEGIPALENLINGLSKKFDITVYSLTKLSSEFHPESFRIRGVNADHKTSIILRLSVLLFLLIKDHLRRRFDLVHAIWAYPSGIPAVFMAKVFRLRYIVSLQGAETAAVPEIGYGHLLNKLKKKLIFSTLYAADRITALTRFQKEQVFLHGFKNREVIVIPHGVDTSLFKPVEKTPAPPWHFIHIANLTAVKDQEMLLRAFKIIAEKVECHLRIVGADYLEGKIQRLSRELKLDDKVTFIGPLKNSDIPEQLAWAHVLLHTSLYESQAVVVAEAAACKVLVCGTRVGLISDLKECTVNVLSKQYEALGMETLTALSDESKRNEMIECMFNWSAKHDLKYTVRQFSNLYRFLI